MARVLLSLSCAALFVTGAVTALGAGETVPATAPAGAAGTGAAAAAVEIGAHMNAMSKAVQSLQAALKEPVQREAALAALGELERNAVIAKGGIPPYTGGRSAEQLPQYNADYRATMIKLVRQMLDIEDNVMAAKYKEANDGMTALIQIEEEGHRKFDSPFAGH